MRAERVLLAWSLLAGAADLTHVRQGGIEVAIRGLRAGPVEVRRIDHVTGAEHALGTVDAPPEGPLRIEVPRSAEPILYLALRR